MCVRGLTDSHRQLASIDSVGNCRFAGYTAYADLYKADIKYTNQPSSQTVNILVPNTSGQRVNTLIGFNQGAQDHIR